MELLGKIVRNTLILGAVGLAVGLAAAALAPLVAPSMPAVAALLGANGAAPLTLATNYTILFGMFGGIQTAIAGLVDLATAPANAGQARESSLCGACGSAPCACVQPQQQVVMAHPMPTLSLVVHRPQAGAQPLAPGQVQVIPAQPQPGIGFVQRIAPQPVMPVQLSPAAPQSFVQRVAPPVTRSPEQPPATHLEKLASREGSDVSVPTL